MLITSVKTILLIASIGFLNTSLIACHQGVPSAAVPRDAVLTPHLPSGRHVTVSELPVSQLDPPLEISPEGVTASVIPLRAHLTSIDLGKVIRKYNLGLVRTSDGSVYQIRRDRSLDKIESSYGGGYFDPQIKDLPFRGRQIAMAAVIQEFDRSHANGRYVGLWPTESGSVVGAFSLVDSKPSRIIPLFTSELEIQHLDFFLPIHGPGVVSIIRKRKNGQAELIELSVDAAKLFKE